MRLILFILFVHFNMIFGQSRVDIKFVPVWEDASLSPDTTYHLPEGQFISFRELKFYVSGIALLHHDKIVFTEKNSFHLVDTADPQSFNVALDDAPSGFDKLKFNLGIDSTTNAAGVLGGDLDPTKGMYWTWQSGYINIKIEGKSNLCTSAKNDFVFHLGGYKNPVNTLQTIVLHVENDRQITIALDLKKFISSTDLSVLHHIMSPSENAVKLSTTLAHCFNVRY